MMVIVLKAAIFFLHEKYARFLSVLVFKELWQISMFKSTDTYPEMVLAIRRISFMSIVRILLVLSDIVQ